MRIQLLATGIVLLAVAGFASIACGDDGGGGGGDGLTLEDYFQQVDELDNEVEAEFDALFESIGAADDLDTVKENFPRIVDIVDSFIASFEDIEPPDEAEDLHQEALEAARGLRDEIDSVLDTALETDTLDDFFAATESEALDAADERFTQVCLDLEELAADNDITVDLDCEEP